MFSADPRQLSAMLKQLGIKLEEIDDVEEVIIFTKNKKIIIEPQEVKKMSGQGMVTFQVMAKNYREEIKETISEEDVKLITEQTGISEEKARTLLKKHKGDLAAAIMEAQDQSD
ncbi:MAG: nascent polypeptide-associated complex protein [Candidatus Nanohaloarchaeota archaeon]|nr:nascent polypeptide-associated complex protein [Candidatus Nanohaloarchaeota archaeon]